MIINHSVAYRHQIANNDQFQRKALSKRHSVNLCSLVLGLPIELHDIEEMMAERGTQVDHSTIQRWVDQYAPQLGAEFTKK